MQAAQHSRDCLSDLALDQVALGEQTRASMPHLAACQTCQARLAQLQKTYAQERLPPLDPLPARSLATRFTGKRRVVRPMAVAGTFAMAAAVLLWVGRGEDVGSLEQTRSKGAGHLRYYVREGKGVQEGMRGQEGKHVQERAGVHIGQDGDVLRPGDAIRFAVTLDQPAYVAVLSVDGEGKASVYFPTKRRAQRVEAGSNVLLPLSTELDDALGQEVIYGVFCQSPMLLEPIRSRLATEGESAIPQGCKVETVSFSKKPRDQGSAP